MPSSSIKLSFLRGARKLNVDANPQIAAKYNVTALPTMLVFKGGQVVDQIVGVTSKGDVLKTIARHLAPAA